MLYGRDAELTEIDRLVAGAQERRSGALVLRGEAGIGKSALLDHAAAAPGTRVLRAVAVEREADMAFAGLHQLLWPVRDGLDALPTPQATALRAALGLNGSPGRDGFLTGLALLTLFAALAEENPLLCVIDDAQWLDQASADALLFAARRIAAEGIVMIFAARDDGFPAPGLPELRPSPLGRADAVRLLTDRGVSPEARDRIIGEARGFPLALLEFGTGPGDAAPLPVTERVLAGFQARIDRLPEKTRLMALIAAAEGRGYLPAMVDAGQVLGVGVEHLGDAERAGLLRVTGGMLEFRHPLIRSAAYQAAPLAGRLTVHRALADTASEPDCRAVHLAASQPVPDEGVAAEVAARAERARDRTAYEVAAMCYLQAADLSPEPDARGRRLAEAAAMAMRAGRIGQAGELAGRATGLLESPPERARLAVVQAAVEFEEGEPREAARLLIDHAERTDPGTAASMLRTGAAYGWSAGDPGAVRTAAARLRAAGRPDPVVEGMAHLVGGDYGRGLPLLAEFVARPLESKCEDGTEGMRAVDAALLLGDDEAALEHATVMVARYRRLGLAGELPGALCALARAQVAVGLHRDAAAGLSEAAEIARDIGFGHRTGRLVGAAARIAAIEGDEERCRELAAGLPEAAAVLGVLDLGLGRYEVALRELEGAWSGGTGRTAIPVPAAADQVEAAVRAGLPERAEEPLRRFESWARAGGGRSWAQAVALRSRAILGDEEQPYAEAVRLHEKGGRPFERARTELLYGEWLRRARRRSDARYRLRSALEVFERLGAVPWAERTRAELRATGETAAGRPAPGPLDRLTSQELQVVRLAAAGTSSRDIAAQLFLSPRTVEYHLYKAYPKLGVSSRRELRELNLSL
ncbi:helix-turn-helix transcriptional regulator [Actinomadura craniellae]|uniref:Helix-turn-helix transcriptional regulator n=1 Tax=Actinomadura craniellae TaxID=2231787 RepID=A0A365GWC9_9ACTN|nr:helix-turn-helix transcriptional regulator [Actinomadura craniellae]RAY11120.1 helix-turn-helix transcriptional regulator [Actinomadura craniellae]